MKKSLFALFFAVSLCLVACDGSTTAVDPIKTTKAVKKSGARSPGFSSRMIGTWKLFYYYVPNQNPQVIYAADAATACQFGGVIVTVTSNGNGGGNMTITNQNSCYSTTFSDMVNDTYAGGRQFETAAVGGNIQWSENAGVGYDNIYISRSNGSQDVARGYRVSFSDDGNVWYLSQDGGSNSRDLSFVRQ